jgi:hypothetical protein
MAIAVLKALPSGPQAYELWTVLRSFQRRRTRRTCVPEHADGSPMHSR